MKLVDDYKLTKRNVQFYPRKPLGLASVYAVPKGEILGGVDLSVNIEFMGVGVNVSITVTGLHGANDALSRFDVLTHGQCC
jgi:hypothetical protein